MIQQVWLPVILSCGSGRGVVCEWVGGYGGGVCVDGTLAGGVFWWCLLLLLVLV